MAKTYQPSGWEKITAFAAAGAIVLFVLFLAFRNEPLRDPNTVVMMRTVLSLATAALGATIPGFLNVGVEGSGLSIRAGGALALFVITFFFTPKVIQAPPLTQPLAPTTHPVDADVGGFWSADVAGSGPQGVHAGNCLFELEMAGGELLGTLSSGDQSFSLGSGKVSADRISFEIQSTWTNAPGQSTVPITFRGKVVTPDHLELTMATQFWAAHPASVQVFQAFKFSPPLSAYIESRKATELQGTWHIFEFITDGENRSDQFENLVIKGNSLTLRRTHAPNDGDATKDKSFQFELNNANRQPSIELTDANGLRSKGVYGCIGTNLAMSLPNHLPDPVPTSLADGRKSGNILLMASRSGM